MRIRNIVMLETCPLASLAGMVVVVNRECILPSGADFAAVRTRSIEGCEVADEMMGPQRTFTTRLRFSTYEPLSLSQPVAMRLTTADGRRHVIGRPERPYPMLRLTSDWQSSFATPAHHVYELTWKTVHGPLAETRAVS